MKTKPILFNTAMVQAVQAEIKTVTRRLIKPQPQSDLELCEDGLCYQEIVPTGVDTYQIHKPPYLPGDIMYVRETWAKYKELDSARTVWLYKADEPRKTIYEADGMTLSANQKIKWNPSIHMPKEAARIFLRVTNVRAERLREITFGGVVDEGTPKPTDIDWLNVDFKSESPPPLCWFARLWDGTINPADLAIYGWKANPWVWVVEFERCRAAWDPILKTFCRIAPNDNKEAV